MAKQKFIWLKRFTSANQKIVPLIPIARNRLNSTTNFGYFIGLWVTSTMWKPTYRCQHCNRHDFASAKGLTQHQQQNCLCFTEMKEKFGEDTGYLTAREETLECSYARLDAESTAN